MTERPTVLIVDDDYSALSLLGIMLDREGFEPVKVYDAHEALAALGLRTPDLIILDLMMPGIDGVRLATILRQRRDTSRTPILMLSSMADQDNIRRGLDAGANDYLIKPVLHAELIAKVRALIKAARS
ncbi:MAG: response regulator [Chloroflexi bacterium]|nr:MAG: response regulator receiver protein [Chloroflexi bacterium OLB13]MBC6955522.1 response regulator [Chloroflexota bacterium]MBV6437870.1 Phosphate regulon transcriptional regulatory protein PhoB [Anaerolineae bacterium]MDL1915523.1 response regulator [Anaerolineae bacterium CFX4]MBW7880571.1 response regulator [Anaerolineae bacterium]